jgi:hypothetical protein
MPLEEKEMSVPMAKPLEEEVSQNLMSETKICAIADRTSAGIAEQGTDGADTAM